MKRYVSSGRLEPPVRNSGFATACETGTVKQDEARRLMQLRMRDTCSKRATALSAVAAALRERTVVELTKRSSRQPLAEPTRQGQRPAVQAAADRHFSTRMRPLCARHVTHGHSAKTPGKRAFFVTAPCQSVMLSRRHCAFTVQRTHVPSASPYTLLSRLRCAHMHEVTPACEFSSVTKLAATVRLKPCRPCNPGAAQLVEVRRRPAAAQLPRGPRLATLLVDVSRLRRDMQRTYLMHRPWPAGVDQSVTCAPRQACRYVL